jgi:hypothetical protein
MITLPQILWCFVIPLAIALVVLFPKWRWTATLAVGAAFIVGHVGWPGVPEVPPSTGGDWIFWLAGPLTAVGLIESLVRMPAWVRAILTSIASVALVWVILRPLIPQALTPTQAATGAALFGLAAALAVESTHHLARREPGITIPLVLMIVAMAGGIMLLGSGSVTQGFLAGPLVATTIAGVVLTRRQPWARVGAALVLLVLLAGLLVRSHFYNYDGATTAMVLLVILAPLAGWAGRLPGISRLSPWKRTVITLVVALIPVGIAMALTIANQPEPNPYGY